MMRILASFLLSLLLLGFAAIVKTQPAVRANQTNDTEKSC